MSEYDNKLQTWHDECQATVEKSKTDLDTALEPDVEQFQRNTLDNIPQQFGDFLYTALGDRVTGQRNSVLNKTFFEEDHNGKSIAERAAVQGLSIPAYIAANRNASKIQLYITAGRKFGVSYITGCNGRTHTIYFGAGQCFQYLTQEHVDCVKNKLKRQCTQDFLDFRDDFVAGATALNEQLVTTPIDVKLGEVSCITKTKKINSETGYHDRSKHTFTVMDNIIDDTITHTIATIPNINIWDKKAYVHSNSKCNSVRAPSFVSFTFLKIDDNNITTICNVDIGIDKVAHGLDLANQFNVRQTTNHISAYSQNYRRTDQMALARNGYQDHGTADAAGTILNMTQVLQNPTVRHEIERRIKFYNDMSMRLQALKHQHATLYFVNADM